MMTNSARQRALAWAPAAAYMLLIWGLSSMSHILINLDRVPFQDKGVHFIEYGMLAVLLAHAIRGTWRSWRPLSVFAMSVLCTTLWGLIDEIHQAFVPGRVADARDLLADGMGALLGACVYALLNGKRARAPTDGATLNR
jgi:VanZ family protein